MRLSIAALALILVTSLTSVDLSAASVKVLGLFTDKALLLIDSERKLLSKGETFEGVTLISASGRGAVVSIEGETLELGLNQGIQGNYKKPEKANSRIHADAYGMYFTPGSINGRKVQFLVDTGATYVTLNGDDAKRLRIDLSKARKSYAQTASGTVPVLMVTLPSVKVGEIKATNVAATVIEGSHPSVILLGNSFLKHTHSQRIGNVMELTQKY